MKRITSLRFMVIACLLPATAAAQVIPASGPTLPVGSPAPATDGALLAPLSESLTGEAKAEYAAARILYGDGDYAGALNKLTTAYRLSADPRLLWNMAAAEKNLRHYAKVIDLVQRYLAAGAPFVSADDRLQAEQLLAAVRGFVSEVTFDVKPAGVEVQVDGQSLGTTPLDHPVALDFGHRVVRLSRAGYREQTRTLELEGGKPAQLNATLSQELHQGTLKVVTDPQTTIRVDGKVAGTGLWQALVSSGSHTVQLEGAKKVPQTTEVVVLDGETRSINILLKDAESEKASAGVPTWVWVAGGVAAVGLGTGAYLVLRSESSRPPIQQGTWSTLEF